VGGRKGDSDRKERKIRIVHANLSTEQTKDRRNANKRPIDFGVGIWTMSGRERAVIDRTNAKISWGVWGRLKKAWTKRGEPFRESRGLTEIKKGWVERTSSEKRNLIQGDRQGPTILWVQPRNLKVLNREGSKSNKWHLIE